MIIQIRGTSGAGKTTVMREVMEDLGDLEPVYVEGRRKPVYYKSKDGVAVLGHYESACGGCDNIGSAVQVFDWIETLSKVMEIKHVLCEGLLLSEDTKWTKRLDPSRVKIAFLSTDIERCIRRVKKRRKKAGNEKPLNENNTRKRVEVIERARKKLVAEGFYCKRMSSKNAPERILKWLSTS